MSFNIRNKDRAEDAMEFFKRKRLQSAAVLDNIRSAFNAGNMMRTADAACIGKLFLCGYTPYPSNPKLEKTALGAEKYIPWEYYPSTLELIDRLKEEGYFVIAMETADESKSLYDIDFPEKTAFIFGNETEGLSSEILQKSDIAAELPAFGMKNSLNVSNAFAITSYEHLRRYRNNLKHE